jgi:type IV pilus assembly protein PilW
MSKSKTMKTMRFLTQKVARCRENGFTLVELMVTLVVSSIVMAAIYSVYTVQQRTSTAQEQVVEMQQNVRAALSMMESEIRMAGYNPRNTASGTGITTANATQLIFGFVADTDGMNNSSTNATIDEIDEVETVEYYLYDAYGDGDMDIGRRTPTNTQAIAENFDGLEFYYTLKDGSQALTPTNLEEIAAVRVSLLVRANRPDPSFTDSATYTRASGATWGPFNDNFRRSLLITTIQCRNWSL